MAHRLLRDTEADGWERSDFPIICESCLGENPYVRMTKANYDKECKICTRPFTVFRWRPGRDARYKKTEVCQTCSKLKNVCQVCLLDLEYGLPVQVRDSALGIAEGQDNIPKSDVNKEFFAEEQDRKARAGLDYESSFGKARPSDTILKLQRTTPYYKRNRAHICSFFVRGECTRGSECPYRHEMPLTGELSQQNIKDRFYGVNDPVAAKLLRRAGEMPSLQPPDDESIRTLYVGGMDERVTEQDLTDQFYGYGELESVRLVPTRACAFVTYTTREGAEKAAEQVNNKLVVKGLRMKLMWGRPPAAKPEAADSQKGPAGSAHSGAGLLQAPGAAGPPGGGGEASAGAGGAAPAIMAPPPLVLSSGARGGGEQQPYYPSMDPQRMGASSAPKDGTAKEGESASGQQQVQGQVNQPPGHHPGSHPGQHFMGPPPPHFFHPGQGPPPPHFAHPQWPMMYFPPGGGPPRGPPPPYGGPPGVGPQRMVPPPPPGGPRARGPPFGPPPHLHYQRPPPPGQQVRP